MEANIPSIPLASSRSLGMDGLVPAPREWMRYLGSRKHYLESLGLRVELFRLPPSPQLPAWARNPEGYGIEGRCTAITVVSLDWRGALYALNSLGQMLRSESLPDFQLWSLSDVPRMAWRGIMIDSSRHFVPHAWLMDFLDHMAEIKLNVLHWHLTDDQGWRFAVPGWPDLVAKGAWREHSEPEGRDVPGLARNGRGWYGGWYTDEQIHQLVAKAESLNILVVPEVDIPGHSGAALCAYPTELGCDGSHAPVLPQPPLVWGVLPHVLCPGKDSSLDFVKAVFGRLAELFPSAYLHLGGDEVLDIASWEHCPHCRARQESLGLKTVRDLEGWFVHRCQEAIRSLGRIPLAWDDVIAQTIPWTGKDGTRVLKVYPELRHPAERALEGIGRPAQAYHFWSNKEHLAAGLAGGECFVFSPSANIYLDMTYGEPEPKRWAGYIPVQKAFEADPAEYGMPDAAVLGMEAPLWTEHLPRKDDLERLIWPRLLCVAEASWVPAGRRDWPAFRQRLKAFLPWLEHQGVAVHREF